MIDNPENIETRFENGKPYKSWGCDAYGEDVFVFVKDAKGNLTQARHLLQLQDGGSAAQSRSDVDWAYYSAVPGQPGYFWNAYNGISRRLPHRPCGTSTCGRWTTS